MKSLKRIICILSALIIAVVPFNAVFALAANPTPVSMTIVKLPDKLKFYKGTDWDWGEWMQIENGPFDSLIVWRNDPTLISFLYHPFSGALPERGCINLTGLKVEITYSDGSKRTVDYKETQKDEIYKPNIYAIPYKGKPYFIGKNTIQIYFPSDTKHSATYEIEIINAAQPKRELGDVDDNGKVNSSDALLLLNHSVKIITLTAEQKKYADMNSDGFYNSTDALMILKKSVA